MARTAGSRNADYEEQRLALARRVRVPLMADDGLRSSMRQLAEAAGTSVANLKHYFGGREGLMVAVMESLRIDGAPHMARASIPTSTDVRESLAGFLGNIHQAWVRFHVGSAHAAMFAEGLSSRALGPSYVNLMLEPFLQVGEEVLRRHVEAKSLPACDLRQASLMLLAPVVFALLHQENLSGVRCRPLEMESFITAHLDAFLRAFPPLKRPAKA
ncbi:MAG: TetR/AcrR family transcriptional regulator [Myxococcaceae bacterium]|nr:TetR/AcrR family transcriptional regulator [Myxococcaceae bacterium]